MEGMPGMILKGVKNCQADGFQRNGMMYPI